MDRRCDDCDTGSFGYDLLSGIHSGNLWGRGGKHRNFGCDTWPQRNPDFSFGVWCHAELPAVELYAGSLWTHGNLTGKGGSGVIKEKKSFFFDLNCYCGIAHGLSSAFAADAVFLRFDRDHITGAAFEGNTFFSGTVYGKNKTVSQQQIRGGHI